MKGEDDVHRKEIPNQIFQNDSDTISRQVGATQNMSVHLTKTEGIGFTRTFSYYGTERIS